MITSRTACHQTKLQAPATAIHSFVFFFCFSIFIYVRSELQCEFVVEKMEKPARTWNSSNYLLAGKQNNKL
jgi:hypothetical protein